MIKKILLAALLLLSVATASFAAKDISVNFSFDRPAESFSLYMDGDKVCEGSTVGTLDCNGIEIDYGMHQFTMTATEKGIETTHSPAYVWSYSPLQGSGPTILNFNVTLEDGTVVPLGAVNLIK